jgi:hypothetical protein
MLKTLKLQQYTIIQHHDMKKENLSLSLRVKPRRRMRDSLSVSKGNYEKEILTEQTNKYSYILNIIKSRFG